MFSQPIRFETRDAINTAIAALVERGVMLDEIDVELSKIGVVDLDLCVDCLNAIIAKTEDHRLAA